jgi:hypothetical protein
MTAKRFTRVVVLVAATVSTLFAGVGRGHAAPPSCAPFNDAGCLFGEDWESGTTSGWAANAPSSFSNVTGGLNGTSRAARLHYSGTDQGIWVDTGLGRTSADGDVFWVEFWVQWSPGFVWGLGGAEPNFKMFEWGASSSCSSAYNRMLMTVHGDSASNYTRGIPFWSLLPNYSGCSGTGQPEAWPVGTNSNFKVQGGTVYHVIMEFKSAYNRQGYIKVWFNGELVHSAGGITTCTQPGGCSWSYIRIGGQYAGAGPSEDVLYDQIRITRTNIAPGAGAAPTASAGAGIPSTPPGLRFQ